jgi:hypothetical protein
MDRREDCIRQASICREKAQSDRQRYDHWMNESVIWLQRAIKARCGVAVTYEVRDGKMVPIVPRNPNGQTGR